MSTGDAEPAGDGSALVTGAIGGAPAAPAALFLAPDVVTPEAEAEAEGTGRRRRRSSRSSGVVTPDETAEPATPEAPVPAAAQDTSEAEEPDESDSGTDAQGGDADDDDGGRKRRRRGRRGRGRGRGGPDDESGEDSAESADEESADGSSADDQSDDDEGDDATDEDSDADSSDDAASSGSSRRRRRRRRRSSEDSGDGSSTPDDPPNTVTHVREKTEAEARKRSSDDEVKGVKGSTRLEAKRQRRRDGREQGRRRPAILSESEFLARREAVERTMVVRQQADRNQIGVLEDGVLVEHFVAGSGQNSMVGNVYLGRVQNVLPSMEAAFVDIGRGRNAVLYAGEVNWDASGLEGKQRKIEQALSSGDSVLVQVTKDPVGHKGARLTTQISLPGRFLVYVPGGGATGISRKLPEPERKRLKDILKRIVPSEAGVIIRTAAEGIEEAELEQDVRRLAAQWEVIERTGREAAEGGGGGGKGKGSGKGSSKAPTLVHEEPDLLIRVVRDMFNEDFSSLVISGEQAWETLEGYISHVAPELVPRLSRHTGPEDVFSAYRIDEQLVKALDRKVWLPSGGTLVIDRTEAMTVVDVNTGKFTGSGGNLEETVTRNNLEAAEEVVRQLRLRDIGGMIVIDFIDMVLESNRDLVLRRLTECLGRDRTRHQVAEVTSLGLVQMTRKRVGQGLLDEFSTPCEHCKGRGVIVHTDPVTGGHEHGRSGQNGSSGSSSGSSSSGSSPTPAPATATADHTPESNGSGQNGLGLRTPPRPGSARRLVRGRVADDGGLLGHRGRGVPERARRPRPHPRRARPAPRCRGRGRRGARGRARGGAGAGEHRDAGGRRRGRCPRGEPDPRRAGDAGRRGAGGRARGRAGAGEHRDAGRRGARAAGGAGDPRGGGRRRPAGDARRRTRGDRTRRRDPGAGRVRPRPDPGERGARPAGGACRRRRARRGRTPSPPGRLPARRAAGRRRGPLSSHRPRAPGPRSAGPGGYRGLQQRGGP